MQNKEKDYSGIRINYSETYAEDLIGKYLSSLIQDKTLIVCIGTDKCIGDCLGPLVGTFLKQRSFQYPVIGTLDNPAHAVNLGSILNDVNSMYPEHFIIAVDACLGYSDCVGDIQVKFGPVHPGKGVGKKLPQVGDISIVGVVDTLDNSDVFSIRNIRLSFIMKMSEIITNSLINAVQLKKDNEIPFL